MGSVSRFKNVLGVIATVVASASIVLSVAAPAEAQVSSKTVAKCQKLLNKGTQKLAKKKLSGAVSCAESLLACQLEEELSGADFAACATGAIAKCDAKLGGIATLSTDVGSDFAAKCATLANDGDLRLNLRSSRGIGFDGSADACALLAPAGSVTDLASAGDCAARSTLCRTDDALAALIPRAYEVLNRAGVLTTHASAFPCLDVRAPSPATPASSASDLLACQKAIEKQGQTLAKSVQKGVYGCADGFLGCQLAVDRLESNVTDGAACSSTAASKCDKGLAKVDSVEAGWSGAITAACTASLSDISSGLGFALTCPSAASVADVADCAAGGSSSALEGMIGTVEPRTCRLLQDNDKLTGLEDTCVPSCPNGVVEAGEACDDGNADDFDACRNDCTVGPTQYQALSITSAAAPANTPDGTPATAVDPGSTLATQFGATTFSLNESLYTRYYGSGAGDPDAVLILIPGFAGGSGSFKYLAENLISRARANADITLEVWAFDRRTNLLEDDAGAELADSERDPMLALDWYFGGALGLPLSPALPRRAVFHSGSDVAFIANWTPHVFALDIDAVVNAANALPSAPKVFLGGHSLGTTFTARYAATDFDSGPGVVPGYSKVDGLVLLEGGGESVAASPPSSDTLDLIIAKADGGLYHAVKNGDGRCVDGTPCGMVCVGGPDNGNACSPYTTGSCDSPGVCTGVDADCVGVPLPPGAVTNKCVTPVDAYTGASTTGIVLVTPQVHAAGDVAAIQGKTDPQGLSLIQTDFGSGMAVDLVSGLGALGALPPSSAEAAVGFFLDDEFSPVSAFQASLGFSNNGANLPLFSFVQPQPAYRDPYRLWLGIDEPMPSAAVPNNGLPSAANSRWGQEKEVSRVDVLFSFLRTGSQSFGDSYFAASGLSTTSGGGGLDTSALSVGRSRPDIENLTQAGGINIPVIAFGGTNGLTPTTASFEGFAKSLGVCTAPTCDGTTPRVLSEPDTVTTVYGDVSGGFEVHLNEGYAHIDVVSAEDDADNEVITPLLDFLERNTP